MDKQVVESIRQLDQAAAAVIAQLAAQVWPRFPNMTRTLHALDRARA
jgi:hypothetical protein